jgi:hypothetical protein
VIGHADRCHDFKVRVNLMTVPEAVNAACDHVWFMENAMPTKPASKPGNAATAGRAFKPG